MKNEVFIQNNELIPMNNIFNICKSTIQIKNEKKTGTNYSSGFFIKFQKNNKPFYCIMTNDHCISQALIKKEKEIIILYENKTKELKIKLNPKERLMKSFKDYKDFSLDITIVQIIEKDQISDDYFLLPDLDYIDKYDFLVGEEIAIPQFPLGGDLQMSKGEIKGINYEDNKYEFIHSASTLTGSSGSPIILKGKESVIGIHKAGNDIKKENYGDFIGPIINIINTLKRNGKGIEYYKSGEIKYEGKFVDDEYDGDDGCFHYESGDIYIGQFKKGKKNGSGCIYDKDNNLKVEGEFLDDELINKEKSEIDENKNNDDKENEELKQNNENQDSNNDEEVHNNSNEEENQNVSDNNKDNNVNENYVKDSNNVNKSDENNNNIFNDLNNIKTNIFHIFQPLGNMIGLKCTACSHLTSKHKAIGFGKWKCEECSEDSNICSA